MSRRVVISGLGVITGLGIGKDALWEGLLAGRSAIGPVRAFDAAAFPTSHAAEVNSEFKIRDFVPKSYRKAMKVMCRDIEIAVAGAAKAVEDAGLVTKAASNGSEVTPTYASSRMGCQIGAGVIVAELNELSGAFAQAVNDDGTFSLAKWGEVGMNHLTPLWLLKYLPNMLACHVTIIHDCQGPSNTITCGEASGALSIGESRRVIERGDADICFSGGGESKINPLGLLRQTFTEMLAETKADEDGTLIVQPFGTNARGTLPGEGAAILTIEALDTAAKRGATVYAEIAGFGAGQDIGLDPANLSPSSDGRALANAIKTALRDAGIEAGVIDAICPFGSGIVAYDNAEAVALSTVFGDRLPEIPLITTKPNIGLCAAATSALDIAVGALCVHHQTLPARINGDSVRAGLNAETIGSRDAKLDYVLVCGGGYGGQNTAVILKRADEVNGEKETESVG